MARIINADTASRRDALDRHNATDQQKQRNPGRRSPLVHSEYHATSAKRLNEIPCPEPGCTLRNGSAVSPLLSSVRP